MSEKGRDFNEMAGESMTPQRRTYLLVLERLVFACVVLLAVSFVFYAFGILPVGLSPEKVASLWHLHFHEFLESSGTTNGWGQFLLLPLGEWFLWASLFFLLMITVIAYLLIIPHYIEGKNHVYALIGILQVLVLVLSASGLLKAGH